MTPEILYEDNHLIVVVKPAGMPVMGGTGVDPQSTLHAAIAAYWKRKYAKPGNVYVGIVHRLDRVTGGVMVVARTSKAAARLGRQFARRDDGPAKIYRAIVSGHVTPAAGRWEDQLLKDDAAARMRPVSHGGLHAVADFRVLSLAGENSLLEVSLQTGRKHQIRVQAASRGHAILGDRKYGGPAWATKNGVPGSIALHAVSLSLDHPTGGQRLTFTADPPW